MHKDRDEGQRYELCVNGGRRKGAHVVEWGDDLEELMDLGYDMYVNDHVTDAFVIDRVASRVHQIEYP